MRISYLTWVALIVCILTMTPVFAQTNTTSQDNASIIDKLTYGKSGWRHLEIWGDAVVSALGAKAAYKAAEKVKMKVKYFKDNLNPETVEKFVKGGFTLKDVKRAIQDNTLESWGVFIATQGLSYGYESGKFLAKKFPLVAVASVALSGGYEYYKNYSKIRGEINGI